MRNFIMQIKSIKLGGVQLTKWLNTLQPLNARLPSGCEMRSRLPRR